MPSAGKLVYLLSCKVIWGGHLFYTPNFPNWFIVFNYLEQPAVPQSIRWSVVWRLEEPSLFVWLAHGWATWPHKASIPVFESELLVSSPDGLVVTPDYCQKNGSVRAVTSLGINNCLGTVTGSRIPKPNQVLILSLIFITPGRHAQITFELSRPGTTRVHLVTCPVQLRRLLPLAWELYHIQGHFPIFHGAPRHFSRELRFY